MAKNIKITPATGLLELIGDTASPSTSKASLQIDTHGNLTLTPASVLGVNYIAALGLAPGTILGTANQLTVTINAITGIVTANLPNIVIFPGIAQVSTTPVNANDLTNKAYVDSIIPNKAPVRATSVTNVTIVSPGTIMFDGVNLSTGQRLLLQGQTDPTENGIYVFNGPSAALTRAADFNTWTQIPQSILIVQAGSTYANTLWLTSVQPGGTIGSTAITFKRIDSAFVAPSAGMVSSNGSVLSTRLIVNADIADVAWNKITGVPGSITSITDPVVNNGLSYTGTTFVLGQTVSAVGDPAKLLSHREIPMQAFDLAFTGTGHILIGSTTSTGEKLQVTGTAKITSLAGTGSRRVVASATGVLGISTGSDTIVDILYSALLTLVQNETLVPGQKYRITDYRTIYRLKNSSPAVIMGRTGDPVESVPFVIVVTAVDNKKLDHVAQAETNATYPNADKWTVWYDINNPAIDNFPFVDWTTITGPQLSQLELDIDGFYSTSTSGMNLATFRTYMEDGQFLTDTSQVLELYAIHSAMLSLFSGSPALPTVNTDVPFYSTVYSWAVAQSKGVIFKLIDENLNETGYDFKNIVHIRYKSQSYSGNKSWLNGNWFEYSVGANSDLSDPIYAYTFNTDQSGPADLSSDPNAIGSVIENVLGPILSAGLFDLNDIVFYGATDNNIFKGTQTSTFDTSSSGNRLETGTFNFQTSTNFQFNVIGLNCGELVANSNFFGNNLGKYCQTNSFGTNTQSNDILDSFQNNEVGDNMQFNTIEGGFASNTIGDTFYANKVGPASGSNIIGNSWSNNFIAGNFQGNNIGSNFTANVVGITFQNNELGSSITNNNFGPNFVGNTGGDGIQDNTFGARNTAHVLGSGIIANTFKDKIDSITLPDGSTLNTFDNGLAVIDFTGNSDVTANKACLVLLNEDSNPVLTFMGNNGSWQVVTL